MGRWWSLWGASDLVPMRKVVCQVAPTLFRWPTLLAWLGGVVTYHLLANFMPDVGATLPALLLAGVLQWVLGRKR